MVSGEGREGGLQGPSPTRVPARRSDGCKLLFQDGYLEVLKNLALSGELQKYSIRGVCWKVNGMCALECVSS